MLGNKHILITGGTGFLGRSLVRGLHERGARVRVLDDGSRGQVQWLSDVSDRIEFQEGDVRDANAVARACEGIDSVCHLAYVNGTKFFYEKPDLVLDVGVKGIVNVLDQMIAKKVPELLLMSSSEVYQDPPMIPTPESVPLTIPDILNPRYSYGGGKILSELMAVNYGRKYLDRVLIVRPHNVFGPAMGWEHVVPQFAMRIKRLAQPSGGRISFPIQGTGLETRAMVYIDDFTRGVLSVLERGEHLNVYHVGTMMERKVSDIAHEVAKYFQVELDLVPSALTKGSPLRRCPDITKVRALGYEPKVSFESGIRRAVAWYDENAHLAPTI